MSLIFSLKKENSIKNNNCASVKGKRRKKKADEHRGEEKENSTKVISAASLSHICSSGKQKQRGGASECMYVGMCERERELEMKSERRGGVGVVKGDGLCV